MTGQARNTSIDPTALEAQVAKIAAREERIRVAQPLGGRRADAHARSFRRRYETRLRHVREQVRASRRPGMNVREQSGFAHERSRSPRSRALLPPLGVVGGDVLGVPLTPVSGKVGRANAAVRVESREHSLVFAEWLAGNHCSQRRHQLSFIFCASP
jgi:hypothetical protein